jgi:hypothetical protein
VRALVEALLDDILDPTILAEAVDEAVKLLQGEYATDRHDRLEGELRKVMQERDRLVAAIATGGQLDRPLLALRAREARRRTAGSRARRSQRI